MSQKINKIVVLIGVIAMVGLMFYFISTYKTPKKITPQGEMKFVLIFKGQDPESGSNLKEKAVPIEGLELELKQLTKNGENTIDKKITNSDGEAEFEIDGGIMYLVYLKPKSSLSNLYIFNNPLEIYFSDLHEGEMRKEYFLKLKEEAKRDIERRNHLIIYNEALNQLKEKYNAPYSLGLGMPITAETSIVKKLMKYQLLDKVLMDPSEPKRITDPNDPQKVILEPNYYRYYSDGDRYLIIAYPEIDFRQRTEPPFVGNYKNKVVYWIGDFSLLNQ